MTLIEVSTGTATKPTAYTAGSNRTTTITSAIGYILSADGSSTYGGTWTWGTTNTSALQTVAFDAASAAAPLIRRSKPVLQAVTRASVY
jgi:hypothetical protein